MRRTSRTIEKRYRKGVMLCLVPVCDKETEKYKRSDKRRNYCEDHGWYNMRQYTSWPDLRMRILERDKYTCQQCGDDERYRKVKRRVRDFIHFMDTGKSRYKIVEESVTNLEVDHKHELADGGDQWDEDNLETLCWRCHLAKTKKMRMLRGRMKFGRRFGT